MEILVPIPTGRELLKRLHCVCDVCGRGFVEPFYMVLMPRYAQELKTCSACLEWAERDARPITY